MLSIRPLTSCAGGFGLDPASIHPFRRLKWSGKNGIAGDRPGCFGRP